jgi:hypothetical protein
MGLEGTTSPKAESRARSLAWLRAVGSEQELLRFCYPRRGVTLDLFGVFWWWRDPVSVDQARQTYYRVTGRPFNAVPPPYGPGSGRLRETFDFEQGGASVGAPVHGLSLAGSRLDGSVDADAGLAYLEWTLELSNDSLRVQEARAQITLPPGGVVSRATLWIDGEEREAAFGGRGAVRQAYQNVVQQRRDPLLVTSAGPDRVLVQVLFTKGAPID